MNEYEAKFRLRELGIHPSKQMIENWIRADEAERRLEEAHPAELATQPTPQPRSDGRKRGSSRSNLVPVLRQQGQLTKKVKSGKRGRPRIYADWFAEVAASVATGLSLPEALAKHGISLDAKALRALSRNMEFRRLLEQERQRELAKRKHLAVRTGVQAARAVAEPPATEQQPETQDSSSPAPQPVEPEAR